MRKHYLTVGLVGLAALTGCLSLSVGGGEKKQPTLADEIAELSKLRDRGKITAGEYQLGKQTLLRQYRPQSTLPDVDREEQLANHEEPVSSQLVR